MWSMWLVFFRIVQWKICSSAYGSPALSLSPRSMNPIWICLAQYILIIITIILFSVNDFQAVSECFYLAVTEYSANSSYISKTRKKGNRTGWFKDLVCFLHDSMISGLWTDFSAITLTLPLGHKMATAAPSIMPHKHLAKLIHSHNLRGPWQYWIPFYCSRVIKS